MERGGRGEGRSTSARAEDALQRKAILYDRDGDRHYDYISAWIKATRGSDPDASLYYLAAMLEGGEDPRFIARRMVIFASEDVGNADPMALVVATAAGAAVDRVGLPECALNLAQAATYLALAPKSNASYAASRARAARTSASTARSCHPTTSATRTTRARGSSAAARATSTRTTSQAASSEQPLMPPGLEGERFYEPTTRLAGRAGGETRVRCRGRGPDRPGRPQLWHPAEVGIDGYGRGPDLCGDRRRVRAPGRSITMLSTPAATDQLDGLESRIDRILEEAAAYYEMALWEQSERVSAWLVDAGSPSRRCGSSRSDTRRSAGRASSSGSGPGTDRLGADRGGHGAPHRAGQDPHALPLPGDVPGARQRRPAHRLRRHGDEPGPVVARMDDVARRGALSQELRSLGIDAAAKAIARSGEALVLNDCLGVMRLHQRGERATVAVIRSRVTAEHAAELARLAGLDAASRGARAGGPR